MAYTDIDRVNGRTIRKLHSPDKKNTYGFLTGFKDENGNLSDLARHANLTEAREHCGFRVNIDPMKQTRPKSTYAQNRPGYDPHAR